ncbi:hypothetical protein Rhopal_005233-T1 [Rhodotorula paludigena]|uniref:beta-N-acetylhexosaminidase n=1 Tax=Rhodotorula paludigena TaxID=86838 RepID=A0AAV5GPW4_9BASI|nr:hypothetical protein Rhopal_005233-T1 [Rhodotorula paludigena]
MAIAKLNVFHWHIVDQQSWPLASPTFPDLAQLGAYSPEEVYGPEDVELVGNSSSATLTCLLSPGAS